MKGQPSLQRSFLPELFRWEAALGLVVVFGASRFWLVLNANVTGSYQQVAWVFVGMAALPFVLLTKSGRKAIGFSKPNVSGLFLGFLAGAFGCVLLFFLGEGLYGESTANWFQYIGRTYPNMEGLSVADRYIYFGIYAVIGMTFSPLGEEFFYRGMVHEGFARSWGKRWASYADSTAFALVHLAHFGVMYSLSRGFYFLPVPAVLWVMGMFLVSQLFFFFKQKSGSIWGAVFAHAGFNFMMTWLIFFW